MKTTENKLRREIARKVALPVLALGLAVATGYWLAASNPFGRATALEHDVPDAAGTAGPEAAEDRLSMPPSDEVGLVAPGEGDDGMNSGTGVPGGSALAPPPAGEEVRDQAMQDPHSSPRALLDFAHSLSGLMVRAMESEDAAREGFGELETCVSDASGGTAVQARLICLANAKRLADQYPDALATRVTELERRNARLVGMLEATGL